MDHEISASEFTVFFIGANLRLSAAVFLVNFSFKGASMNRKILRLATLTASSLLAIASFAQAQYDPYRTFNPYTGTTAAAAAAYNPYTGAGAAHTAVRNPYTGVEETSTAARNPYTGTTAHAATVANPYTGTVAHEQAAYNPYTGAAATSRSAVNANTGARAESATQHNPYTGATTHEAAAYNPMTGNGAAISLIIIRTPAIRSMHRSITTPTRGTRRFTSTHAVVDLPVDDANQSRKGAAPREHQGAADRHGHS